MRAIFLVFLWLALVPASAAAVTVPEIIALSKAAFPSP